MGRALALLACSACAFALNPDLDISQYSHKSWTVREGLFKNQVGGITQTPDGYLWLGTEFGLLRFDGIKLTSWDTLSTEHLPSNFIRGILAARDGTLWIGTLKGLASWKDGKLAQYPELAGMDIHRILEDREGNIWAGTGGVPTGRLCEIRTGSIQCQGEDGRLGQGVFGLYEDSKSNLWAGVANGLWRWKPGPSKFYPLPGELDSIQGFAEGEEGALLVGMRSGVRRVAEGTIETSPLPGSVGRVRARRLLRDREGSLWIGTAAEGLVHVHRGRTDVFSVNDGLSGDSVGNLFEDREGNIWVSTSGGLDRFRDFAAATFSVNQGLSGGQVAPLLADRAGSVWLNASNALNRWENGQITIYQQRNKRLLTHLAQKTISSGLPAAVTSMYQDDQGRLWVATLGGFGYLENDRFIPMNGVPARTVFSFAEDPAGNLWISDHDLGLIRLSRRNEVQTIPWAMLGRKDFAFSLAPDPSQGGLWLGFLQGVAYFKDGQIRASYGTGEGLGEGRVSDLRTDRDGTLWASTEGGLSRLKNGHVSTLSGKNGLPCDTVLWLLEDDDHSVWLYMPCGLVRVTRPELDAWVTDPKKTIQAAVYDSSDGVGTVALTGGYSPHASKSPDGKLWFVSPGGASVIDPRHLPFNKLPPPVQIEQIVADRKTYATSAVLKLPPLTRDLEIDYTALSLVNPEKNRFRYKLEGRDRDWVDAGSRRQALYSDLRPRDYRFRVMASNNSGVWNEAGASFDFSVAPAYYQTTWFLASVVAVFLALLAGLYQLRVRQVAQRFQLQMEGRVAERTRIARDLHDTLLQSFQGVLLKFSAARYMLPDRPDEAGKSLDDVIEQARAAITEGRDAVQGLRSSTVVTNDLARAIGAVGEELAASKDAPEFDLHVEGTTRDLTPLVRDEVYRVASEAVRNAFRHAQARRIEVEIQYDPRQLRLRIRDNGKGIDPTVLGEGGRAGHHGLPGMHERSNVAGGKLGVWSELDAGTEIELTIPASIAYAKHIGPKPPSSGDGD
jgi:signal transduction histidine kinase/ligand-binding sensor domain-containing protein